jgi:thiamine pyrophosphate-dependent acetolactate synthase large subunit-like protein
MWSAQLINCQPKNGFQALDYRTMGFGLPAAIGAKNRIQMNVICVTGDSSIQ